MVPVGCKCITTAPVYQRIRADTCGTRPVVWERVHARENWDFLHDMRGLCAACFEVATVRDRRNMVNDTRHIARGHHDV
jgi:hypothetical protein